MNNKKIALFFPAENHAGKTTVSNKLVEFYHPTMAHFSVRDIIKSMYKIHYGCDLPSDRRKIKNYSELSKAEYGPEIFIEEALRQFDNSSSTLGIIESVRSVGEALWIKEHLNQTFPNIMPLIIGLTAPTHERYGRFLSDRPDNIATELTLTEFNRHEVLSNGGRELWEENIAMTMLLADRKVVNYNNKLDETVDSIKQLLFEFYAVK